MAKQRVYQGKSRVQTQQFVISSLWFDVIWLCAVIGQERWLWVTWLLVVLSWATALWRARRAGHSVLLFMVSIAVLGNGLDWLNIEFGLLSFASAGIPNWLVALWCGFSWYLLWLLVIGAKWSMASWTLFGALGGSISYLGGARLDAVFMPLGIFESVAILAIEWACLFVGVRLWWERWSGRYINASF